MATKSTPATRAAAAPRNRVKEHEPSGERASARKWDIDLQHNLDIEWKGDTFRVRVQELSMREWEEAMEEGEQAVAALLDEALLTPKSVIPARYAPLVVDQMTGFFTAPAASVGQDGETATDAPEAEWDDGEEES